MTLAPAVPLVWRIARGRLRADRPLIAGILNVTPDSFWDGARHATIDAAMRQAERLIAEGADLIDVGGESTRPGARQVEASHEIRRVLPVVEALVARWPDIPVSVDTVKAAVARAALEAGAAAINDVSALRLDPDIAEAAAGHGAGLVLMHSRGSVEQMASYELARYGADVVADVTHELGQAVEHARAAGVSDESIVLDPGLGFAKRGEDSLAVLSRLGRLVALGYPVMVGPSRKRFIGDALGGLPPGQRLEGTLAACVMALLQGARFFRVHDVAPARRALDLAAAVQHAGGPTAQGGA